MHSMFSVYGATHTNFFFRRFVYDVSFFFGAPVKFGYELSFNILNNEYERIF